MEKFFENIDDSVFDFFVTKNTQWSYEKEKRILVHMSNRGEAIHEEMIKIKPSVIIIGEKMNLPNRFLIASICKNKKIPLFIVENSYSCQTFRLGIRPVLPIEIDRIVNNFDDFLTFDGLVI